MCRLLHRSARKGGAGALDAQGDLPEVEPRRLPRPRGPGLQFDLRFSHSRCRLRQFFSLPPVDHVWSQGQSESIYVYLLLAF